MTIALPRLARVPPFERGITLGDFLVPIRLGERISSRARHVLMIALGSLLIVVGARISFYLPGNPLVPVTLQTFGVLFGGALLGSRRGVLAVLLYLVIGAIGVPVFAYSERLGEYASGIGTIAAWQGGALVLGPTGGYLVGFLLASALVGRLAELGWDRRLLGSLAAMLLANAVIYVVGLPWLMAAAGLDPAQALEFGLLPFIPGDLLKLAVAAGLLPVGWWFVNRRPEGR
ncbi:MAG TPA: biotin transporter BioY [Candidatus Limnocylindrales bacterium]|nr:biotin transporter BioY [Candidatus Limnocylindrales bacterium]